MSSLALTPEEQKLSNLLIDVSAYIDESRAGLPPLVLRFAGGWVRDKCLGKQSQDVDIAINLLTGTAFAAKLKLYLEDPIHLEKHGLQAKDVRSVHTIKANPDKSKHLETVTTKIFDLDVDLVNLRKETYTDGSRNPIVEFGTAEEDALRRDATINALFYNVHTRQVSNLYRLVMPLASYLL
jgi:tRNA nucleotidyltransferase (CCA-adding enzyme)